VGVGEGVGVGVTTSISDDTPKIEEFTVSLALTVCPPPVLSVTEKFPTPLVSVVSPGSTAAPSLLVK
jgi:hypothetical protein